MSVVTDKKRIDEIFSRGIVSEIIPSKDEFLQLLLSGRKLKIYIGADPTSSSLHLSHAKNYMFLEELRELGHEAVILVGDFTAQIGDPSERTETRKQISEEKIKENVREWISQIKPLTNFEDSENPPRIVYNSEWLSKLSLKDLIPLASNFTVQQMLERDMFEKRLNKNIPIYLHEFLYPLMQGYDSAVLDVDVELCGTDQIFNALAGRTLLKRLKNKDKFIIALNLMENPKTKELMSKSKGTGVFLSSLPNEMYGAIMAQPDEMIEILFINCTRIPLSEKDSIMALGPRNAKARVAFEIVKKFYGDGSATQAEQEFISTFSKKEAPKDIPVENARNGERWDEFLIRTKLVESKAEAKRLINGGGVDFNDKRVKEPGAVITKSGTAKIGKTRFIRIEVGV